MAALGEPEHLARVDEKNAGCPRDVCRRGLTWNYDRWICSMISTGFGFMIFQNYTIMWSTLSSSPFDHI